MKTVNLILNFWAAKTVKDKSLISDSFRLRSWPGTLGASSPPPPACHLSLPAPTLTHPSAAYHQMRDNQRPQSCESRARPLRNCCSGCRNEHASRFCMSFYIKTVFRSLKTPPEYCVIPVLYNITIDCMLCLSCLVQQTNKGQAMIYRLLCLVFFWDPIDLVWQYKILGRAGQVG